MCRAVKNLRCKLDDEGCLNQTGSEAAHSAEQESCRKPSLLITHVHAMLNLGDYLWTQLRDHQPQSASTTGGEGQGKTSEEVVTE